MSALLEFDKDTEPIVDLDDTRASDYLDSIDESLTKVKIPFSSVLTRTISFANKKVSYVAVTTSANYIYAHNNLGITDVYKDNKLIASIYTIDQHKTELAKKVKPHKLIYYYIIVYNNILYGVTLHGVYKTHIDLTTNEQKSTEIDFGYDLSAIYTGDEVSANKSDIYIKHGNYIMQITKSSMEKIISFEKSSYINKMLVTNDYLFILCNSIITKYKLDPLFIIKQFEIKERNVVKLLCYEKYLIIVSADSMCAVYLESVLMHRYSYDWRGPRINRVDRVIDACIINDKMLLLYASGRTRLRHIDI
jgi:hypothetical protein